MTLKDFLDFIHKKTFINVFLSTTFFDALEAFIYKASRA